MYDGKWSRIFKEKRNLRFLENILQTNQNLNLVLTCLLCLLSGSLKVSITHTVTNRAYFSVLFFVTLILLTVVIIIAVIVFNDN